MPAAAQEPVSVIITVISASKQGSEFDIENDSHRDKLIELFSFNSYRELDQKRTAVGPDSHELIPLAGGYTLSLILLEETGNTAEIEAKIEKDGKEYLRTAVSITLPGTTFLGGVPYENGSLLVALDVGY